MSIQFNSRGNSPWSGLVGLAIVVFLLFGLFMLARFAFRMLFFLSPFMFIASLIIDYRVFLQYLGWIGTQYKRDPVFGILVTVLSIVGFPVVSLFLLGRALFNRQANKTLKEYQRRREGELVDYEEVEDFDRPRTRAERRNNDDFVGNP